MKLEAQAPCLAPTGTAGVSPAMSAEREPSYISKTFPPVGARAGETPAVPVEAEDGCAFERDKVINLVDVFE
jgi:hypothetical protein